MRRRSLLCLLGGWLGGAVAAQAASVVLDDTGSYAMESVQQMRWRSIRPQYGGDHDVESQVRVVVRIDTRAWAGRNARIYMALPLDGGPPLTAEWQTQGRLLAGRLVSGGRGLVYAGAVPGPALEDQMLVRLRTDGRWNTASRRLAFHFELDTD